MPCRKRPSACQGPSGFGRQRERTVSVGPAKQSLILQRHSRAPLLRGSTESSRPDYLDLRPSTTISIGMPGRTGGVHVAMQRWAKAGLRQPIQKAAVLDAVFPVALYRVMEHRDLQPVAIGGLALQRAQGPRQSLGWMAARPRCICRWSHCQAEFSPKQQLLLGKLVEDGGDRSPADGGWRSPRHSSRRKIGSARDSAGHSAALGLFAQPVARVFRIGLPRYIPAAIVVARHQH